MKPAHPFRYIVVSLVAAAGWSWAGPVHAQAPAGKPNIVIVVADDMGWRDTGCHGNPIVKTPNLDDMAAKGLRFDYFYPGQQMCSPGRFAILSGRNPFRTGLHHLGSTRPEEIFLPRALKLAGYRSGHFGKWHLGSGRSSPIGMGFDYAVWSPNYFDLDAAFQINDSKEKLQTKGESSIAIMDVALEFIRKHAKDPQPFLVQVCFGSPHSPHKGAEEFKALYKDLPAKQQDFWAEVSGLDAAVGKLRQELKSLGIADNTIVWFTSDNGGITKDSMDPTGKGKMTIGCRTQGILEWPARIPRPMQTSMPCGHVDIYPTLLELAGVKVPRQPVLDGISLVPLIDGKMTERPRPLGFMLWNGKGNFNQVDFVKETQAVWIDGKHKLVVNPPDAKGKDVPLRLHDIHADPAEKANLAEKLPDVVTQMRTSLEAWQRSVRDSYDGKDFAKE